MKSYDELKAEMEVIQQQMIGELNTTYTRSMRWLQVNSEMNGETNTRWRSNRPEANNCQSTSSFYESIQNPN